MKNIFLIAAIILSITLSNGYASHSQVLVNREMLCQRVVRELIKSPATYKIIDTFASPAGKPYYVHVKFDAQNVYGATLRDTASCKFTAKNITYYDAIQKNPSNQPITEVYFKNEKIMLKGIDVFVAQVGVLMDMDNEEIEERKKSK